MGLPAIEGVAPNGLLVGLARLCVQAAQPVCWLICQKSVGFVGCCLLALLPEVWVLSENGRKNERKYLRLILRLIAADRLELARLILEGQNSSYEELPASDQSLSFQILEEKLKTVLQIDQHSHVVDHGNQIRPSA